MYTAVLSVPFQQNLKRLCRKNPTLRKKVTLVIQKLLEDPRRPSLRLHKLSGKNDWSISLNMHIRLIFRFEGQHIFLLRIGTHDEVYG